MILEQRKRKNYKFHSRVSEERRTKKHTRKEEEEAEKRVFFLLLSQPENGKNLRLKREGKERERREKKLQILVRL